ncbi:flagellar M-ring protein FliF [Gammaproteobacteria bacterium]
MAATELTNRAGTSLAGNGATPGTAISASTIQPGNTPGSAGTAMVPGMISETLTNRLPLAARFLERFNALPSLHQVGVMVGLAAAVAFIVVIILWSRKEPPPYQILFGGLAETDTAQIVEALQKNNIPYRIDPITGALTVPAGEIHATRIRLAGMGLPKTPPIGGFEILDNQSPFGTSQFMEGARYQRALEGELAHSILTMAAVQSARVHLALPRPSVFVRDREKPSASVMLQMHPGRYLDRNQVEAIVHLVASSIPQLEPNRVTVVDQTGELLTRQDSFSREMDLTKAQFEHVHRVEDSYIRRIEHMLAPLAGINGIRAQVTVDMDFSDTEQTREVYNPDQPSLRSEQTVDEQSRGVNEMGIPGALSNQPPAAGTVPEALNNGGAPPDAGKGNVATQGIGTGGLVTNKRHATRNYEVDRTISHTRSPIGQIRRISAAVAVDDAFRPGTNPPLRISRSPEEMERIRALVREAVGYDAQRGDAISVVNLAFMPDFEKEPSATEELPLWRQPWAIELFRQGLAALLILVIILGVVRPVMRHMIGEEDLELEEESRQEKAKELEALQKTSSAENASSDEASGLEHSGTEAKKAAKQDGEEDDEEEEEEEEYDTRELRPAGEGAEEESGRPPEDHLTLSSPSHESELPPWLVNKKNDYDDSLEHIRYLIREEPKMVSEILKDWILSDNPNHKNNPNAKKGA